VWEDEEITFAEFLKMLRRYATGLQKHGIQKGDKVLVHLDNSLENMIALYSVMFAGGVAVLSVPALSNADIFYRTQHSNATYIVTTASEANRFSEVRDKLQVKGYFTTGVFPGFLSMTEFQKLNENDFQECHVEDFKSEVIVLSFTSGSTGPPKAVEHTHYSFVAALPRPKRLNCDYVFSGPDVFATWVSITLFAGLRFYLRASCSGAKIVLFSSPSDTAKILDTMRKYRVTMFLGSVNLLVPLARKMEEEGIRLDSLKTVLTSGTIASPQILKQLKPSFDPAIVKDCYGSTEVGGICSPPMGASKGYGIGFPVSMAQIKIVDTTSGKTLGPNEQGEALVKSPCAMKGYYKNPDATSRTITLNGWVRTGDICYYNEEGWFFFVERMNQLFRCMGITVAPSSIESVLLSHEGIKEAAVIGVPHPKYMETAMAFVVLNTAHSKLTEIEVEKFVAGQLGIYMHLHGGVKFVHTIPKDGSGKVQKTQLQALQLGD
ncbi:4-coumarate--CoA ligase 2, partial [Ixodes scapularis]